MKAMRGTIRTFLAMTAIATTLAVTVSDAAAGSGNPHFEAGGSVGRSQASLPEGFVRTTVDGADAVGIWQNGVLVAAYAA
jgi:hypothetical protein